MVTYHVMHMGSIRRPGRITHLDVQVEQDMTVRELVIHMLGRGDSIGKREDYQSDPLEYLHVIVNGTSTRTLNGPSTLLHDGDTVAVMIPLVGGAR